MSYRAEHWSLRKPVIRSRHGLVAAQEAEAAACGAAVLRAGGNAVDAAVVTALCLATTEPWMSGIGGGGVMLIHLAAEQRTTGIDYSMTAPAALDPARYPLSGEEGPEDALFVWPRVVDDRNMIGPEAVAVPGAIAGFALALERYGTLSWAEALAPAIETAERGLAASWYATLQIAFGMNAGLGRYPEARATYLPNGAPLASQTPHAPLRRPLGRLPETLRHLAAAGPRDFYEGETARRIVADMAASGGPLTLDDLGTYEAFEVEPLAVPHHDGVVRLMPGLNAGPTCAQALRTLDTRLDRAAGLGADVYVAWAEALTDAYEHRLAHMGHDGDASGRGCTTHLCAIDAAGNMVSLTNTLLERFGSRFMLPGTGILMNNGIYWFDPRPGRPNAIKGGVKPLNNMAPVVVTDPDGTGRFALGASGGRRIAPAVFQLTSMLLDFDLDLEDAVHRPRIDASGDGKVAIDRELPPEIRAALAGRFPTEVTESAVGQKLFANPQVVMRGQTGAAPDEPFAALNAAAAHVQSPTAAVARGG
ncbi:MAG: gamma-glutamyltransferase [Alphaproteobacteria bacterium]|nr:gamma-glutamyltransferase [Alphaproteobacteria bacterium]MCY4320622.1 gamma-glutamyltransferase [Alphaproteobacteria bacterium]